MNIRQRYRILKQDYVALQKKHAKLERHSKMLIFAIMPIIGMRMMEFVLAKDSKRAVGR